MRLYTVFNQEQCDGLTISEISRSAIAPEIGKDELCESIVTGWENRPALYLNRPTEYRAYYRLPTDSVHMPARPALSIRRPITAPCSTS